MDSYFINYATTIDKDENDSIFMDFYGDTIISLFKKQAREEEVNSYSYSQYRVLLYNVAYQYCLFLFFLSLDTLENETLDEAQRRCKLIYNYYAVQTNLAHVNIDIDSIYDSIVINYEPVEYEQV